MKSSLSIVLAASLFSVAVTPAFAQKLGVGGTGVDDASALTTFATPVGTIALVEEKAKSAPRMDAMPPQFRAMIEMVQAQEWEGGSVDPLPLLKLLAAPWPCFVFVDRGAGFDALQRERSLAAGASGAAQTNTTLHAAEYMLVAQVVYSDAKSRQSGGAAGGLIGGLGFQKKTLDAQTLLTLASVKIGVQVAVASGQARKKDIGVLFGGLSDLGVGALGGTYALSDRGKITTLALLDGFRKLTADAQIAIPPK